MSFGIALNNIVGFGLEIADFKIPVIYRLYNGNDNSADTQKLAAGHNSGIPCQIYAIEPVDIGACEALTRKVIVLCLVLHFGKGTAHGFGCLVREPEPFLCFLGGECVIDAKADDNLTLAVRVARIDNGIDIRTVAERFDKIKLPSYTRVDRLFIVLLTKLEFKPFGKAGEVVKCPALILRAGVGLHIGKRKEVSECPCYDVVTVDKKTVLFLHRAYAGDNVTGEARLFRDNEFHRISFPWFVACIIYCSTRNWIFLPLFENYFSPYFFGKMFKDGAIFFTLLFI